MKRTRSWLAVALLAVAGCHTVAIPEPASLAIPPALDARGVEVAILAALDARQPPPVYDPTAPLSEEEYDGMVRALLLGFSGRAWMVESREPGSVVAVLSRPHYELRTRVDYDAQRARVAIVDSRGLRQDADSIHRKAASWVRKLELRIQNNLNRLGAAATTLPR